MQLLRLTLLAALLMPLLRADDATSKWGAMDYGPTLACTLQVDKQYVLRALIVRLDPARQTYLCYDLETCASPRSGAAASSITTAWSSTAPTMSSPSRRAPC